MKSVVPGGVVAYVTCSPHRHETVDVVETVLDEYRGIEVLPAKQLLSDIPDCELGDYLQLWPHRHNTDAMFLALLRIDNLRG
ncbi:MAG: hypothetical protein CR979_00145 [Propionibacterium sp.]|nr:MAG: hypothetical protein CR979_00145 [Propionibacterium sp.]